MATHKFELSEGGYFYRFYPKCAVHFTETKSDLPDLFNPTPKAYTNVFHSIFGMFVKKFEEKSKFIIQLHAKAFFGIQDEYTAEQEGWFLESHIILQVSKELYHYPFEENKLYTISPSEIKLIRP